MAKRPPEHRIIRVDTANVMLTGVVLEKVAPLFPLVAKVKAQSLYTSSLEHMSRNWKHLKVLEVFDLLQFSKKFVRQMLDALPSLEYARFEVSGVPHNWFGGGGGDALTVKEFLPYLQRLKAAHFIKWDRERLLELHDAEGVMLEELPLAANLNIGRFQTNDGRCIIPQLLPLKTLYRCFSNPDLDLFIAARANTLQSLSFQGEVNKETMDVLAKLRLRKLSIPGISKNYMLLLQLPKQYLKHLNLAHVKYGAYLNWVGLKEEELLPIVSHFFNLGTFRFGLHQNFSYHSFSHILLNNGSMHHMRIRVVSSLKSDILFFSNQVRHLMSVEDSTTYSEKF